MTILRLAFALTLAGLLGGCARQMAFPQLAQPLAGGEERRILVTFVDRSIGRDVLGNLTDRYQMRGGYANSSWSSRIAEQLAERHGLLVVAQWPVTVLGVACVVYEIPEGRAVETAIKVIAEDRQVDSVQTMQTFRVLGTPESNAEPYSDPYYRLQKQLHAMQIDSAHRIATGRGVRIAVIDTGIDSGHPDLKRQVAVSENLAGLASGDANADIHGTAVAGVIAAEAGNGIGIVGIAPNADILALRACWPERAGIAEAVCNSFTLALAINEAVRLDSHIINLSLAGPRDALVEKLLQAAIDRGIIVVAADPATKTGDSQFPATMRNVIAVRSDSADSRPSGSAANGITAPGAGVLTTVPQGAYDFMNGSSFAAPHISGILALMRELKPRLNGPDALVLLRTLEAPSLSPASQRLPSVNACQALAEVSGRRNCGG